MKQILLPIAGVALFIIFVGVLTQKLQGQKPSPKKELEIGNAKIEVEVSDTLEKRKRGLSGKASLGENSGMLFVFEKKNIFPSFWMRDMHFLIDIIWIKDSKVAKIDKNVPVPKEGTPDTGLTLYYPDKPIDYVLEVNAGFSDKNNIKVGDKIEGLP